jgi:formylglycine-generating enzyme required for sulfatase activity
VPVEGDDTVVIGSDKEEVVGPDDFHVDPVPDADKRNLKKWLWPLLAGLAVVAVVLLAISRPFEPDDLSSDLSVYNEYLHQGDSLSQHEGSLSEAISAYDSASAYEQKYSDTRYVRRFRGSASSKSASVQFRIDSIRVSDSLAAIAAAEAAAARAELERQEKERKQREAYVRLKRSSSYKIGVLKVGSVEYPMVYVSGGSFDMGATSEQGSDAQNDEKPLHRVTLSSYRIGKYEVTQELWEAVMGSNPSYFKGSRRPVECVSWDACQEFIRKLNALTGQSFRLPTEAEWEYASRGGKSSRGYKYSGSNTIGDVAWYSENSENQTHNVGTKSPNELGLYDMSGNVEEWCSDRKGSYSSSSQTNPKGSGSGSFRAIRGGSWFNYARYCLVSNRLFCTPGHRDSDMGLRLCH